MLTIVVVTVDCAPMLTAVVVIAHLLFDSIATLALLTERNGVTILTRKRLAESRRGVELA